MAASSTKIERNEPAQRNRRDQAASMVLPRPTCRQRKGLREKRWRTVLAVRFDDRATPCRGPRGRQMRRSPIRTLCLSWAASRDSAEQRREAMFVQLLPRMTDQPCFNVSWKASCSGSDRSDTRSFPARPRSKLAGPQVFEPERVGLGWRGRQRLSNSSVDRE